MENEYYVTASEIGEYVYCKRAWWLRFQGLATVTDEMKAGSIKHTNLQKFLFILRKLIFFAIGIILIGIILFLLSLFLQG